MAFRSVAGGDRAQYVDGGGQPDGVVDHHRALALEIAGMQDEAAAGFHRPAEIHHLILDRALGLDFELLQQIDESDLRHRLVDHQPHRPLIAVRAEIDDGAGKARIGHTRHGDQQLPRHVARLVHFIDHVCAVPVRDPFRSVLSPD